MSFLAFSEIKLTELSTCRPCQTTRKLEKSKKSIFDNSISERRDYQEVDLGEIMINFLIVYWSSYWSISRPVFANCRAIASLWRTGVCGLTPKRPKAPSRRTETCHRSYENDVMKCHIFMIVLTVFSLKNWSGFWQVLEKDSFTPSCESTGLAIP